MNRPAAATVAIGFGTTRAKPQRRALGFQWGWRLSSLTANKHRRLPPRLALALPFLDAAVRSLLCPLLGLALATMLHSARHGGGLALDSRVRRLHLPQLVCVLHLLLLPP